LHCCLLAAIQDMQAMALNKPMELIVYPNADHNFSFAGGLTYRQDDADDAWKHTTQCVASGVWQRGRALIGAAAFKPSRPARP
jgi:dienelactone hydrolase